MPPKKKDGGKKDSKKKESVVPDVPDDEERELLERELALTYLRNKLGKYQQNQEFLATENSKLQVALEKEKNDLRDINEILTSELKVANVVCENLERNKRELEERVHSLSSEMQVTIDRVQRERDDTVRRLRDEINSFQAQLSGVDEFIRQKEELETELALAKETIVKERKDHAERLADIERQHVQDRERWKKELAQKIKETKTQMLRLTDQQLEITTKRTIMENELMSSELSYQMTQTEQLTMRNKDLSSTNSEYKMQLELAKLSEQELAKRNLVYQRSIRSMLQKIKVQDERIESLDAERAGLQDALRTANERTGELEVLFRESDEQKRLVQSRYDVLMEEVERWKQGHRDVSKLLTASLDDVKHALVATDGRALAAPRPSGDLAHPLLAAADRDAQVADARDRPMQLVQESNMDQLLRQSSVETRTAAVRRILNDLEASLAASPDPSRALAVAAMRSSAAATRPSPKASREGQRPSLTSGPTSKRQLGSSLPPLHKLSISHDQSSPSSLSQTARDPREILQASEYPGVELLMYQLAADVRPWGGALQKRKA